MEFEEVGVVKVPFRYNRIETKCVGTKTVFDFNPGDSCIVNIQPGQDGEAKILREICD